MKKIILGLSIGFLLTLVSCASNKVAKIENVYENDKDFISNSTPIELEIEKEYAKEALTEKSNHVSVTYSESPVPLCVYKLNLEKSSTYKLTLKSIPDGLGGWVKDDKRTVMIPEVILYDENFNKITNENIETQAVAPTTTEPFLYRVITEWNVPETGVYYFVVKADMTSDQGISLKINSNYNSWLLNFRRILYGKYKVLINKN